MECSTDTLEAVSEREVKLRKNLTTEREENESITTHILNEFGNTDAFKKHYGASFIGYRVEVDSKKDTSGDAIKENDGRLFAKVNTDVRGFRAVGHRYFTENDIPESISAEIEELVKNFYI
jgi:hypothetical protein